MPKQLMLWVALLFFPPAISFANETAAAWESAVASLQQGDAKTAESAFTAWIAAQAEKGIVSPEAHYNLGLAHWSLKQPGASTYHFLKSADLYASPWSTWGVLRSLQGIERELGIGDGVSSHWGLRLRLLVKSTWLWWLGALGFWGLVVAGLMVWLQGTRARRAALQVAIVPSVFLGLTLMGCGLAALVRTPFGVLDHAEGAIAVYRVPESKKDQKVLELPAGTVAARGRIEGDFVEIFEPVAGWISRDQYRPVLN